MKCVTMRTYVARLQEKLGASNRMQLGRYDLRIEDGRNRTDGLSGQSGNRAIGQSGNRAIGQ